MEPRVAAGLCRRTRGLGIHRYDRIVPYHRIADPAKIRRLMDAVLMIEADVELPDLLRNILAEACSLVGARYAALGVLNEERTGLDQFLTTGLSGDEERAIGARPTGRGVLGLLVTDPQTLRLDDLGTHPESYGFPARHPVMTSFLGVPIRVRASDEVFGNLYLTNKIGADAFNEEDEALAESFALAAGIAIENTRLHERVRLLSVLDDRERIGRDLHDRVVQRLFALGMGLQAAQRLSDPDVMRERVSRCIDDVDATINEIRTTIFELGTEALPGGLRQGMLALAHELTPALGFRPELSFSGAIDNTVPQPVADQLLAVLRELLTNAAKHANAHRVRVALSVSDDAILEVTDDGIGIPTSIPTGNHGFGLSNLRSRAQKMHGTMKVQPADGGGTTVAWRVPLPQRSVLGT
jgi:signal transduction histidine kinase